MRKIREFSRLHSLGLTQRQVALSCSTGQSTVSDYLKAAESAGLQWPEIADWDEVRLEAALLPRRPAEPQRGPQPEPDFAAMHAELQRDRHLTLQLLWQEYRAGTRRRLRLLALLRPLPPLARPARRDDAPRAPRRREAVRRLGRAEADDHRSRNRRGEAPRSSSPRSARATTPTPRRLPTRRSARGSRRTSTPSSSSAA